MAITLNDEMPKDIRKFVITRIRVASHADVLRLVTRSWGGMSDEPKNCVGGYMRCSWIIKPFKHKYERTALGI